MPVPEPDEAGEAGAVAPVGPGVMVVGAVPELGEGGPAECAERID